MDYGIGSECEPSEGLHQFKIDLHDKPVYMM